MVPNGICVMMKLAGLFMIVAAIGGCSGIEPATPTRARVEGWSSVTLPNSSKAEVFDAGVYAMKQWFRLDEVSPADGQIRSATVEYDQRGGTERIRDTALKFKNRMRRSATLVVQEVGTNVVARCAVQVQRSDTSDHRVFRDNQRFIDYPNETPIDREAGVTAGQDQVWTDMPRDRQLESDILSVVKSRIAGRGSAPTSAKAS